jgi:L-amino acid N-acyltransferase YncA
MPQTIRLATDADAEQIQAIYAPFCTSTPVSFELEPPTVGEMRFRIGRILQDCPWLVCEDHGKILGYVYASRHRERPAYQWSVDVTVYIGEQHRRKGIGRALYTSLFAMLRLQGFHHAYAGITLPNPGSVRIHEVMGFQPVGVYRAVGFKCGAWHDVSWWQLELQPLAFPPKPPSSFRAVTESPECRALLGSGLPR